MKINKLIAILSLFFCTHLVFAETIAPKNLYHIIVEELPAPKVPKAEIEKIYRAAGFKKQGKRWLGPCRKECKTNIQLYQDLNQDDQPEAIIFERGSYYGSSGISHTVLSRQANGQWEVLGNQIGSPIILKTKGWFSYPDILIRQAVSCLPIFRFNGKQYEVHNNYDPSKQILQLECGEPMIFPNDKKPAPLFF